MFSYVVFRISLEIAVDLSFEKILRDHDDFFSTRLDLILRIAV